MSIARAKTSYCVVEILDHPDVDVLIKGDHAPIKAAKKVLADSDIEATGDTWFGYTCTCTGQRLTDWKYMGYDRDEDLFTIQYGIDACPSLGSSRTTHVVTMILQRTLL